MVFTTTRSLSLGDIAAKLLRRGVNVNELRWVDGGDTVDLDRLLALAHHPERAQRQTRNNTKQKKEEG